MAGVEEPVASPMELVNKYLAGKGLKPTSENVRRTLEQAARDPEFMPAMRTQEPPQDERPPSQRTKSVARDIEQPPQPTYGATSLDQEKRRPGEGEPVTSAQPAAAIIQPTAYPTGGAYEGSTVGAPSAGDLAGPGLIAAILAGIPLIRNLVGSASPVAAPASAGGYNAEGAAEYQAPVSRYNAEGAVENLGTSRNVDPLSTAIDRAVQPSAVGPSSQVAPMSPAAPGPGPSQEYIGNARPDTSVTLQPKPIPIQPRGNAVPIQPPANMNFRTRPPMRLFFP